MQDSHGLCSTASRSGRWISHALRVRDDLIGLLWHHQAIRICTSHVYYPEYPRPSSLYLLIQTLNQPPHYRPSQTSPSCQTVPLVLPKNTQALDTSNSIPPITRSRTPQSLRARELTYRLTPKAARVGASDDVDYPTLPQPVTPPTSSVTPAVRRIASYNNGSVLARLYLVFFPCSCLLSSRRIPYLLTLRRNDQESNALAFQHRLAVQHYQGRRFL